MSFAVRKYFFLFVLASSGAFAASQLAEQPPFSLSPKDLLAQAQSASFTGHYDAAILLDEERWVFTKDGQIHRSLRFVYQVITPRAVEGWSSLEFRWEPWHQQRPVIRARVVTADGVAHELDQKTIVEAAPRAGDSNMYSDLKILRSPLPAVAPGAVVEEQMEQVATPILTGEAFRMRFGRTVPIHEALVSLEYPDKLPLSYDAFLLPNLKPTKSSSKGVTHLLLETGPLSPQEDLEPMLPFDVPRGPQIIFSTGGSWQELASAYNKIVETQIAAAPVAPIVEASLAGTQGRAAKITALVRALHKEIRYTGVEFGDAAIVPAKPAATLERKYGDCKDKAAVLAAMLRQAGIPAYLALLSSGFGQDADPQHPGFGLFDHAIVYVPGTPDLWIDATAEYLQPGFLPAGDQGRLALVIRPETTSLTAIPESPSSAQSELQTREFFLPDYGYSRVVETTEGIGNSDAAIRSYYGSADTDDRRKGLSKYMRDMYLSDAAAKVDHPKADDFSAPFRLRLEIDGAKRGTVTQVDGVVAMPLGALFAGLPSYFKTADKRPTGEDAAKPPKKRTADFVISQAFTAEWRYRIHLPPGFQTKQLPENQDLNFGPSRFSTRFRVEKDLVFADFKFDSAKRRYTAEEGAQLKKALTDFFSQPLPTVRFEPIGQTYLAAGKVREAIEQFADMAKQHPDKPVYRVQLSRTLLEAGCGRKARAEARHAVDIDPKSALAQQNLGWILLHDLIGRNLAKGYDPIGAEAAYRKAIELDPKEKLNQRNLAILFEHDANGRRYESPERLNEAIKIYRQMEDELASQGLTVNLLYDLTYTRRFDELKREVEKLSQSAQNLAFKLAAITELSNSQAAIKQIESEASDEATRGSALRSAGEMLLRLRDYPAASDLLSAGAKGAEDPAQIVRRANAFRQVKRVDDLTLKTDSPENVVRSMLIATFGPREDENAIKSLLAAERANGITDAEWHRQYQRLRNIRTNGLRSSDLSSEAYLDFLLSIVEMKKDQNGDDGFRVRSVFPGAVTEDSYVVRQGKEFRVIADNIDVAGVGRRVLEDVQRGDLTSARRWLDWVRENQKIGGTDDPFGGPVFPRIWAKGSQADATAIRFAAASLMAGAAAPAKDAVPLLRHIIDTSKDPQSKTLAQIAFVQACTLSVRPADALPVIQPLAKAHPESPQIALLYSSNLLQLKRWNDLESFARERIKRDADDMDAGRFLSEALAGQGKYVDAETVARKQAESSKGSFGEWNQFDWFSLYAGDVTTEKAEMVQRATNTNQPDVVHTVAAMYADLGKNTEARETVLAAMQRWGLEEPNGPVWLVFGRLADRFGIHDEALADYAKVEPEEVESPDSNYTLAQRWLAGLKK